MAINGNQWQSVGTVGHSGAVSSDVVVLGGNQWQSMGTVGHSGAVSSDVVVLGGNQWQSVGTVGCSGAVSSDVVVLGGNQWQSVGTVGHSGAVSSDVVVLGAGQRVEHCSSRLYMQPRGAMSGTTGGNQRSSEVIRGHQSSIKTNQDQSRPMRSNQEP